MKFLFKYPTRNRPDWFRETLANYYQKLSGRHEYKFVIAMDNDDSRMNSQPIHDWLNNQMHLEYFYSEHANKIQACNSGIPDGGWDILVLVSDDMTPIVQNFDDIIAQDMQREFPELDGALHYWDGRCAGTKELITCSIMGKKLYDKIGFVYWPSYEGVWCDNDFTDLVKMWGKYWYSEQTIIRHDWRVRGADETYNKGESTQESDKKIYEWRKSRSFPVTFSQNEEDWFIRKYFKDKFKGKFLDIGAADGVVMSNTKILYDMGWDGVAVEPSENHCKAMAEYCPRTRIVQKALTKKNGPVELYHSLDLVSTLNEAHKNKWQNNTTYHKIGVDGICWQTLLTLYGSNFDFINIDIEGENVARIKDMPELYLLKTKMLCIEYDDGLEFITNYLQRFRYNVIHTNGENVILAK